MITLIIICIAIQSFYAVFNIYSSLRDQALIRTVNNLKEMHAMSIKEYQGQVASFREARDWYKNTYESLVKTLNKQDADDQTH